MRPLTDYKLGIGPMSKNVVDACIDFANNRDVSLMLIPSRRQIEWNGGYSNGWTTEEFAQYVKGRTNKILLMRDHGGPGQGNTFDDGLESLRHDTQHFDFIHLDPWKMVKGNAFGSGVRGGWVRTRRLLEYCYTLNPHVQYEIGTEEAIFRYDVNELDGLIEYLKEKSPQAFGQIRFTVIQSGTSLKGNTNTGRYDANRLSDMLVVCERHGLLAKEHNGDYLSAYLIKAKFTAGLNAINLAPELGQIESQTYLGEMDENQLDSFYQVCHDSGRWIKWFSPDYTPTHSELTNVCGHYVISTPEFQVIKRRLRSDIDEVVKANLTRKLEELYGATT